MAEKLRADISITGWRSFPPSTPSFWGSARPFQSRMSGGQISPGFCDQQPIHRDYHSGKVFASCRDVAEFVGKMHKDVQRAIDQLECRLGFHERNFAPMFVETMIGKRSRKVRTFDTTKTASPSRMELGRKAEFIMSEKVYPHATMATKRFLSDMN